MQAECAQVERAAPVAQPSFVPLDAVDERAIFVWHHPPPASVRRGAAIVLCPPIGYEYMSAYPTVRILAERLAALGFDALRIDYDGTGNSTGDSQQPDGGRPACEARRAKATQHRERQQTHHPEPRRRPHAVESRHDVVEHAVR